ncbi:unnamed protein product [Periconia digitata]|uniref:Thioredoxin-like fold domain-containing protein n=1 Tax=Periconia digitata TaxID=1303443 RepID=A0A9W4XTV3_9PLEO|nr:unnamed protein product [Periconia digitata]
MANQESHKLTLFRGSGDLGLFVWSPFVTKLEFRLRISNTHYVPAAGSPPNGPRKKIPYLDLTASDGSVVHLSDTTWITRDLIKRGVLPDINAKLSPTQSAIDTAVRIMLEEKLFFLQSHERWVLNFETMRDKVFSQVPLPQRDVVGEKTKNEIIQKLDLQGTGRFTDAERWESIEEIWTAIDGLLQESKAKAGDGECFWILGGSEPTEADATVFGYSVSSQACKSGPKSAQLVKTKFPVVLEYARRIQQKYFADYAPFDAPTTKFTPPHTLTVATTITQPPLLLFWNQITTFHPSAMKLHFTLLVTALTALVSASGAAKHVEPALAPRDKRCDKKCNGEWEKCIRVRTDFRCSWRERQEKKDEC